ncbi:MAG: TetR family transcriptional regulator, partial [Thermoleophilaceae bacterium]|nr:TetR family transcriptional regulator [Thermoleophilaceae bacterium]
MRSGGRAGVSRSVPYRHFAGKEALLAAVAAADLRVLGAEG